MKNYKADLKPFSNKSNEIDVQIQKYSQEYTSPGRNPSSLFCTSFTSRFKGPYGVNTATKSD